MTFSEFKESIQSGLVDAPDGLTWQELRAAKNLAYERPCPTWVKRLESEIGLRRVKGSSRALVWILGNP